MKIDVNIDRVKIVDKEQIESGEYNVTQCLFTFSDEFTDLIKTAVFTKDNKSYKMDIINNACAIPNEVLESLGTVELGVYGYSMSNGELDTRYSPKPYIFKVVQGSYREAENSEPPTPTQFEQYEEALEAGLQEVQNVDIDASKSGKVATVTITNRNGTEKSVTISDGQTGQQGPQGPTGPQGPAGKNGTNGKDGKDGVDGKDGKDGTNGQDGYTPVRGTDYWTSADIAYIEQYCANYIDQNINQAIGGSY